MKIIYHHRTLGDGAEGIHIREMIHAFRELGHTVKVLGPVGEEQPAKSRKFSIIKKRLPQIVFELLEITYTGYSFFKLSLETFFFKPDFIYDRYITFNAGTILASRLTCIPVILEVNAPLALERSTESDEHLFFRKTALFIEKWTCNQAFYTIVVSTPLKNYLISIGVSANKCFVMPNGVNPDIFFPKEKDKQLKNKLGIPKNSFIIGFTGVLRPWHGLDLLLDAIAEVLKEDINIALLIVGDGPYRLTLEKKIRTLKLEGIVYITGRISHQQIPSYVALFDVAVCPRATFYASPMKLIEYMALARPVLVPNTDNFKDIIDEGKNGLFFEKEDPTSMAKALVTLYRNPELQSHLSQYALNKVTTHLNWVHNAKTVCSLVENSIVNNKKNL